MIDRKRLEELRKVWGQYSMMGNITVSKRVLVEMYDTLDAALKVVEAADKNWLRDSSPELDKALAPFLAQTGEKE